MKKIKLLSIALSFALIGGVSVSCVGDLNVTPIDPSVNFPDDVLTTEAGFEAVLAKCYQGLAVSSSEGEGGDPDISGVDGGYGQYLRALVNMNELTTDVMTCCWNDAGLPDLHAFSWNSSNNFIMCMYYRVYYQVSLANEFLRRANAAVDFPSKAAFMAEARALRLLSYYHGIDIFGNIPFALEDQEVGTTGPEQIKRADLFAWMETEAKDLLEGNDLAEPGQNVYGRCDKGMVMMILAKLYLNAEVWAGTAMYDKCAEVCDDIIAAYDLADNYAELFCADNHLHTANKTYNGDEIIFAVNQDGINIRSYGATNFLIFAAADPDAGPELGITAGWGGLSLTGTFTSKFESDDARAMFARTDLPQYIDDLFTYKDSGWKSVKFTNINHDGTAAQHDGFVDTDFPLFRVADAYLMYAECAARGAADKTKGQNYLNAIRTRAGVAGLELTVQNVLDERARELYLEGFRRQDLIRYNMFTTDAYLWDYKGGVKEGRAVSNHFNLMPLVAGDVNASGKLTQNEGY